MDNYNGLFTASYSITVKSNTHQMCLYVFNYIKHLVEAFNFGNITWKDAKSARKGDVLSRYISIHFEGYSLDVITFRSALDYIIFESNIYYRPTTIILDSATTIRKDARLNLLE